MSMFCLILVVSIRKQQNEELMSCSFVAVLFTSRQLVFHIRKLSGTRAVQVQSLGSDGLWSPGRWAVSGLGHSLSLRKFGEALQMCGKYK